MSRQRLMVKLISVVTVITFLWTNCVWAGPMQAAVHTPISTETLAAWSQLKGTLGSARVVYTGTALHSALIGEGITDLKTLYLNQEKIREKLKGTIGDATDKLKTLIFEGEGGIAYYTFSPDGYFYRFTTAEDVDDPFNRLIEGFITRSKEKLEVPINGDTYYQETLQISPNIVGLIDKSLGELYPESTIGEYFVVEKSTGRIVKRPSTSGKRLLVASEIGEKEIYDGIKAGRFVLMTEGEYLSTLDRSECGIGITGGGDCAGIADFLSALKIGLDPDLHMLGVKYAGKGLSTSPEDFPKNLILVDDLAAEDFVGQSSTPYGSARVDPLKAAPENTETKIEGYRFIYGTGGDDHLGLLAEIARRFPNKTVVGTFKSIDGDGCIAGKPAQMLGFSSAVEDYRRAIWNVAQSVKTHEQWTVIEVFGRKAGKLAYEVARRYPPGFDKLTREEQRKITECRDSVMILVPERPVTLQAVAAEARRVKEREGSVVVVVAEGFMPPELQTEMDRLAKNEELKNRWLAHELKVEEIPGLIECEGDTDPRKELIEVLKDKRLAVQFAETVWESKLDAFGNVVKLAGVRHFIIQALYRLAGAKKVNECIQNYEARGASPSEYDQVMGRKVGKKMAELVNQGVTGGKAVVYFEGMDAMTEEPVVVDLVGVSNENNLNNQQLYSEDDLRRNGVFGAIEDGIQNIKRLTGEGDQDTRAPNLVDLMLEASGKSKEGIPDENIFKQIGFDGDNARLGWVNPPKWVDVNILLTAWKDYLLQNKKHIIFIGMGGSINTIKALINLYGEEASVNVYALDSLDGRAIADITASIGDEWSETLVVPISKSATTKETHTLANTLKQIFDGKGLPYEGHFVWMSDIPKDSEKDAIFGRLGKFGVDWTDGSYCPIQPGGKSDIGGRFTAPFTMIYLLPLYIMLNQDSDKVKAEYTAVAEKLAELRADAANMARELHEAGAQYYAVRTSQKDALTTWITQLFQESLGGKKEGFNPKTLVVDETVDVPEDFTVIDAKEGETSARTMAFTAYYLECLVASLAYYKGINFVNQPGVELYKHKGRELEGQELEPIEKVNLQGLINNILLSLLDNPKRFIEVVVYANRSIEELDALRSVLQKEFPTNDILVFEGSDWNHHSYQATPTNEDTLFVIVTADEYIQEVDGVSEDTLNENARALQIFAHATYQTMMDKALICSMDMKELSLLILTEGFGEFLERVDEELFPVIDMVSDFDIARITPSRTTCLGMPTVRLNIELVGGARGHFVVPAGTSTGEDEARTVGVEQAIENLAKIDAEVRKRGLRADQLTEIAELMLEMGKDTLGAEVTLSYQTALAWAVARQKGLEPYELIRELIPDIASRGVPKAKIQYNITNGGEHAENSLDMQEFMVVPVGRTIAEANKMCDEIDRELGLIYQGLGLNADPDDNGVGAMRGKEGGYKIEDLTQDKLQDIYRNAHKYRINNLNIIELKQSGIGVHEFVLNCMLAAIKNAGYEPSTSGEVGTVSFAFDPATSSMLVKGHNNLYHYEGRQVTSEELADIFAGWVERYPVDSIEDGMGENDWDGWMLLIEKIGDKVMLIGDDNLVTQAGRLTKLIGLLKDRGFIDASGKVTKKLGILIKLNQNGFLTTGINDPEEGYLGTLEVIRLARRHGIEPVISHRSKEAEPEENEVSIAELAAGVGAYALKSGDHVQGIRAVKEDRLAEIDARERAKAGVAEGEITPRLHLFPRYIVNRIIHRMTDLTVVDWQDIKDVGLANRLREILRGVGEYDRFKDEPVVKKHLLELTARELGNALGKMISPEDVYRVILYHEQLEQQVAKLGGSEFIEPILERLREYYREQDKDPDEEINRFLCGFARNYPGYLPEREFPSLISEDYQLSTENQVALLRELLVHSIVEKEMFFGQEVRVLPPDYKDARGNRKDLAEVVGEDVMGMLNGAIEEILSARDSGIRGSHLVRKVPKGKKRKKETSVYKMVINEEEKIIGGVIPEGEQEEIERFIEDIQGVLDELKKLHGLGICTMVDEIQIVENLGGGDLYRKGRAPLASYKDGVLKIDRLLFNCGPCLFFESIEHELLESIGCIIPGCSEILADVVATFRCIKRFLKADLDNMSDEDYQEGILEDLQEIKLSDILRDIDPDNEYYKLLSKIRMQSFENEGISDDQIILLVVGYVMRTKLYENVRNQLGVPRELARQIRDLDPSVEDALKVFDVLTRAKQGGELVEKVKEIEGIGEEVTVSVSRTIRGLRIEGIYRLDKTLQRMITIVTGQIYSVEVFAEKVTKVSEAKFILVDEKRLKEFKEAIGKKGYGRIEKTLRDNNYEICTEIPEGVAPANIIVAVDPADLEEMNRVEGVFYLPPMPLTRSALYMAANIVQAGGDVAQVDSLVKGAICTLYREILGRPVTEDDLKALFTRPWDFLPELRGVIADLNYLRNAALQTEKMA